MIELKDPSASPLIRANLIMDYPATITQQPGLDVFIVTFADFPKIPPRAFPMAVLIEEIQRECGRDLERALADILMRREPLPRPSVLDASIPPLVRPFVG